MTANLQHKAKKLLEKLKTYMYEIVKHILDRIN